MPAAWTGQLRGCSDGCKARPDGCTGGGSFASVYRDRPLMNIMIAGALPDMRSQRKWKKSKKL